MPQVQSYPAIISDTNAPVAGVQLVIDPQGSARMTQRPLDHSGASGSVAGGHFRAAVITGATTTITGGSAGAIASLRWTDSAHYFVLLGVRAWANINTVFTTAQIVDLQGMILRSYTAVDSGGTAILPLSGNSNKCRDVGGVTMGGTLLNDLRVATTGGLTAGTRTRDTQPFCYGQFNNSNALGNAAEVEMYKLDNAYDHPVILGANEGLAFEIVTTQGAAGKVVYGLALKWAECLAF